MPDAHIPVCTEAVRADGAHVKLDVQEGVVDVLLRAKGKSCDGVVTCLQRWLTPMYVHWIKIPICIAAPFLSVHKLYNMQLVPYEPCCLQIFIVH